MAYGGTQPNISAKMISDLFIPFPPLAEQVRIARKIEELFLSLDIIADSIKTEN